MVLILGGLTVKDPALWTHLAAGRALAEEAAPATVGAEGWLFSAAVFKIYAVLGLRGLVAAALLISLATTAAVFTLFRRLNPHFAVSVLLSAAVVTVAWRYLGASVHLLTLGLVATELNILWAARTGHNKPLLALPLLFALWSNLSFHFVLGIGILCFAVIESIHDRVCRNREWFVERNGFRSSWIIPAFLVSVAATLATPLGTALYPAVKLRMFEAFAASGSVWTGAPEFRSVFDWLVLTLGIGGAYGLGKRGELRPFNLLLLVGAAFASFHAVRESWCLALVGGALIADSGLYFVKPRFGAPVVVRTARAVALASVFVTGAWLYAETAEADLEAGIAMDFPSSAAVAVEKTGYRGTVTASEQWAGFLTWRLDGVDVESGSEDATKAVAAATLVVAEKNGALGNALRGQRRLRKVFEDDRSLVYALR